MKLRSFLLTFLALFPTLLEAQGSAADYARSAALGRRLSGKLDRFSARIRWLPEGRGVWWREEDGSGKPRFVVVDRRGLRREGSDRPALGIPEKAWRHTLPALRRWDRSRSGGRRTTIRFENGLKRPVRVFWVDGRGRPKLYFTLAPGAAQETSTYSGHLWICDFAANDLCGIFRAEDDDGIALIDARSRKRTRSRQDPDGQPRIEREGSDLVQVTASGKRRPLTRDGNEDDYYEVPKLVSPDGRYAFGFRVRPAPRRRIPLLESCPEDRDNAGRLHRIDYLKPGDPIAARRPVLIDLKLARPISIDVKHFPDPLRYTHPRWSRDSRRVSFVFDQRGHQRVSVFTVEADTGELRELLRESSEENSFIDTTQKRSLHWLKDGDEFLWASERDGWNHLYRYETRSGRLLNQVTEGPWVMRRLISVDETKGTLLCVAMGYHPGQDPYHEHLLRARLDGGKTQPLTASDGTHRWRFSDDGAVLIARWSRIDHPEVCELRNAKDGALIAILGQDGDARLRKAGFVPPTPFHAKGRDGKSEIWGWYLLPSNFDPARRYPVIENVYAGPHGHHVPKSYGTFRSLRRLAELGFIVVRIDGMGTNWRSKAFHDVCWRNLKDGGFPDRILWMKALAKKLPALDLERVGIYGGSAGGQNALAALLHFGEFYKAAAADCGCHDNRIDKRWWNEAWMGTLGPHYAENSNVTHAHRLRGKLFLTVGEMDRNVDPTSTLRVVDALIRADRDFEMIYVPGGGHGVGGSPYLFRRRQDFFVRSLMGVEPRH